MVIRPLSVFEREDVRRFYLGLSAEDRHRRFCSTLSDASVSAYVDRLNFARDTFLGAFDERAQLTGLAELACGAGKGEAYAARELPPAGAQDLTRWLIEEGLA